MIDARRAAPTVLLAILLAGCASATASTSPTVPSAASGSASPSSPPNPAEAAPPTACLGLGSEECAGVRGIAISTLEPADPMPVYVQVGLFGCRVTERCPRTLAARPEGDVVIEFPAGQAINVHVKALPDGSIESTRGEAFGVAAEPGSVRAAAGPAPYTLGHCGLFSGIDFDGSWWDPVGPVDDHSDAINAADGVITLMDPDHGSFVSRGGLIVQLLRHAGAKHLPMCQ
jgi:hypothetical protein